LSLVPLNQLTDHLYFPFQIWEEIPTPPYKDDELDNFLCSSPLSKSLTQIDIRQRNYEVPYRPPLPKFQRIVEQNKWIRREAGRHRQKLDFEHDRFHVLEKD